MNAPSRWLLALGLLASALAATPPAPHRNPRAVAPRVASFDTLAVAPLNAKLADAADAREPWVRDPVEIGLREAKTTANAVAERSDFSIQWKADAGENADAGVLVVVDARLKDDSVEATWDLFRLVRLADGSWRATEHCTATRCQRGTLAQTSTFHGGACP